MKTKCINVKEASFPDFSAGEKNNVTAAEDYTHLLLNVPLDVRVEIGKTKMTMSEVLRLAQGSIIRLEKQAGAPVDIIANNQTVAKGDVIVIDENFGVRITEIITSKKFIKEIKKAEEAEKTAEELPAEPVVDENDDEGIEEENN